MTAGWYWVTDKLVQGLSARLHRLSEQHEAAPRRGGRGTKRAVLDGERRNTKMCTKIGKTRIGFSRAPGKRT